MLKEAVALGYVDRPIWTMPTREIVGGSLCRGHARQVPRMVNAIRKCGWIGRSTGVVEGGSSELDAGEGVMRCSDLRSRLPPIRGRYGQRGNEVEEGMKIHLVPPSCRCTYER